MSKYHISKNGKPGKCTAKKNCPLGGENEHYSSFEEAQEAVNKKLAKENSILANDTVNSLEKTYTKDDNGTITHSYSIAKIDNNEAIINAQMHLKSNNPDKPYSYENIDSIKLSPHGGWSFKDKESFKLIEHYNSTV